MTPASTLRPEESYQPQVEDWAEPNLRLAVGMTPASTLRPEERPAPPPAPPSPSPAPPSLPPRDRGRSTDPASPSTERRARSCRGGGAPREPRSTTSDPPSRWT